ncbi:MAG: hypothetical protein ABIY70_22850 [Capsulimonas sp.]|uniref:hypothetical protein n=1 Tax=Capsulimonas sp. TaxID=2494211 RepID=UPI00326581FB
MRPYSIAAPLLLALTALPVSADTAAADIPIKRVTLYTSGVGYFERAGSVSGDAAETLLFPTGQINDVLKSLVMLDSGGGTIQPVTYAAQDALGRQLQAFSIDLSDNPSRATLLNRLRGAEATVSYTDNGTPVKVTGTIMGVETQTVQLPNNGGVTQQSTLNLLTPDGLISIPLTSITSQKLTDPKLNEELNQALMTVAQSRSATKRAVTLNFKGRGSRSVRVGYLTEAPLWQTSYRLVLGAKPIVQGWAMVQNTTQDDWKNVDLSLVSGRPISFIQDLYTPLYVPRPVVQARVQASPTPQTYASDINAPVDVNKIIGLQGDNSLLIQETPAPATAPMAGGFGGGGGFGGAAGGYPGASRGRADAQKSKFAAGELSFSDAAKQAITASGAQLGTALFAYQVKTPVDVPRQQSAMIPFLSSVIHVEEVSIFNANVQTDHPLLGARVKNTTGLHLMGGPLTVFDDSAGSNGYVGDALIDDTEPNQTRLISYAVDQALDAESKPGDGSGDIQSIVINQGTLIATNKERQATVYTFKNHSAKARTLVVEQPYPGEAWKLLEPKEVTEHTPQVDRFDLAVPAGASKNLTIRRERLNSETYGLMDTGLDNLTYFITTTHTSDAVKAALKDVMARRRAIGALQQQIDSRKAQIAAISVGQTRIRDNMKALDHASTLYKRYANELNTQETQLENLQKEIDTLSAERSQKQLELNNFVAKLTVD